MRKVTILTILTIAVALGLLYDMQTPDADSAALELDGQLFWRDIRAALSNHAARPQKRQQAHSHAHGLGL